ncbi:MAG: homoserine O-succinyltransferase [Anaerolineales bacterium]|nr:homoserine O-succinyltransferase [Anaerolineales bacterium]
MPVRIPETLPARDILQKENIFVMGERRAERQDIRPLRLALLNLMPTKIATETQLLRLIGNSPLQVEVTLLHMASHQSRNTPAEHLLKYYQTFEDVKDQKFDGLIVTGAPVEHLPFEEVDYWPELQEIFDWQETHVFSTFNICWASQAALYHRFGIPKYELPEKMFGVFPHRVLVRHERVLRGFDDEFFAPHSRYTEIRREDILQAPELELLSESDEAGVYMAATRDRRRFYITGHSEYDPLTLKSEYDRDIKKGLPIAVPKNYYPDDDPNREPVVRWRGHSHLLFSNWLNYYVYQTTPYNVDQIPSGGTYDP